MRRFLLSFCVLSHAFLSFQELNAQEKSSKIFESGNTICFLGDSITHGGQYHEFLQLFYATRYPNLKLTFHNCGISGDNAEGIIHRLDKDVFIHKPSHVFLMTGMNDVIRTLYFEGEASNEIVQNRKKALDEYKRKIDILDKSPGIYSARWAGKKGNFKKAIARVYRELSKKDKNWRDKKVKARFICALSICYLDKKIASVLQRDLVEVLQGAATQGGMKGILISVTKVNVTVDLSIAKVYLSIFPIARGVELLAGIRSNAPLIKHELSQRTKHQLRRMPQLIFSIDDSLEYIDQIDKSLKRTENPIDNPDLLEKRKKV